ncbi:MULTISPECIES: PadR family transcriptional regulator [unclassified Amycolatopsis]|uniref:PadR family transcriptional regulator n=1 Tax=unclassified Amycolatopsis TaxID=2618356 RepID=UPI003451434C
MTSGTRELSATAYVVLGMVAQLGVTTPYAVKQALRRSIGQYWPIPHAQLYAIAGQLQEQGLLEGDQETSGRRRKTYYVTEAGHRALREWLSRPDAEPAEIRSVAWLKLAFSDLADPESLSQLAAEQVEQHRSRIARHGTAAASDHATQLALELDRAALRFWTGLAARPGR